MARVVKVGAIAVPINVLYRGREIAHILADAAPAAVITTSDRAADFEATCACWIIDTLEADASAARAVRPSVHVDAATPVALIYTSGTTGVAKGAVLTHGNFAANALSLLTAWGITSADRYFAALPLFHVHGLGNGIQCWLASGCHMRLRRAVRARAGLRLVRGVPAHAVLRRADDVRAPARNRAGAARAIGEHMRLFVSGSAPLPAQVHEDFAALFGHVILERYGMTETLMNVEQPAGRRAPSRHRGPADAACRRAHPRRDGRTGSGRQTGELWVKGPNVCGVLEPPDATAAAFVDGWFRTGDLGMRGADGYITLQGRRSDLIISGGFNIYPREIEEVLTRLPGIREAAVVGVADAYVAKCRWPTS